MKYYCEMCMKKKKSDGQMYSRSADFEKHLNSKQHLFIINQLKTIAKMKDEDINKLVYSVEE